jgi:hypothetical protein
MVGGPGADPATRHVGDPLTVPLDVRASYLERLAARRRRAARLEHRESGIAAARFAAFVLAAIFAWLALRGRASAWWLLLPGVVFAALVGLHARTRAALALVRRSSAFYERGLARIDERWAGTGVAGERYRDPHHPYVDDLDLFGRGSLFELLCTCRTHPGEARLASWLATPAEPDAVRARQGAAAELGRALDLREDLSRLGDDLRSEVDGARIVAWATRPIELGSRPLRLVALALGAAAIVGLGAWAAGMGRALLLVTIVLEAPVHALTSRRRTHVVQTIDEPARALRLVAELLGRFATEAVTSPALRALRHTIADALPTIRRLGYLVDVLDAQRNPLFAPIALATLWQTQVAFAIEAWRRRHGAAVSVWLDTLGDLEALVAVGGYAVEHPADTLPELVEGETLFHAEAIGHPLLPAASCVRNDVRLDASCAVLVVSGSNMSGKSTLLRTVGVSAVLAQVGAPVRAARLRLSPFVIGASIRTLDSLQEGTSRFYAEITRLRQLVAMADGARPLLFLLDEILHGTNSHDRRIGAEAIVRGLVARGAIGLVTTHDLALASIADDPSAHARNVHFADRVEDARMVFDYRMHDGVVTHSNALALMRAVGLDV